MRTVNVILLSVLILGSVACSAATRKLGADFSGDVQNGAQLMEAFFGNYLPVAGVSYLEPNLTKDSELLCWKVKGYVDVSGSDVGHYEDSCLPSPSEMKTLVGKIPEKYLGHWRMSDTEILLFFEAGGWEWDMGWWGGTGFDCSHSMGAAVYSQKGDVWRCTGYDLNLGWFGAYCQTTLNPSLIKIAESSYAVQTLDYSSALIAVVEGKPKVILRAPCWKSSGHGDPEYFQSTLSTKPNESPFYDIIIETTGTREIAEEYDNLESATEEQRAAGEVELHHLRHYKWDSGKKEYQLDSSDGNVDNIIEYGDLWFPSPLWGT